MHLTTNLGILINPKQMKTETKKSSPKNSHHRYNLKNAFLLIFSVIYMVLTEAQIGNYFSISSDRRDSQKSYKFVSSFIVPRFSSMSLSIGIKERGKYEMRENKSITGKIYQTRLNNIHMLGKVDQRVFNDVKTLYTRKKNRRWGRLDGVITRKSFFSIDSRLFGSAQENNIEKSNSSQEGEDEKSANNVENKGADNSVEDEERVISLSTAALKHLGELKEKQGTSELCLRMGVRSGGCSGMSYVMDICSSEEITEEDHIEEYADIGVRAVIDPKSLLYLFGLQLDYKDALIGGGFQFYNPNADETCGCGKSFGV